MTLSVLDHVVFGLLLLVFPVWDRFELRKSAARIHAGDHGHRMTLYKKIFAWEWGVTIVLVAMWFLLGRTATDLGFVPSAGLVPIAGYALTVILCVLLVLQMQSVVMTPEGRASMRKQLDWLSFLTPSNGAERRAFNAVSVTAGVCEEVIYRGYLTAYFAALLGMPLWGAAILSSIVFGIAHMYQGPAGILRTGLVGVGLAGLYLLTDSLWAPMLVHAVMDLASGHIGYKSFNEDDAPDNGSAPELAA